MAASPQLENGYIRIANELFRAIYSTELNGSELRILFFVIYQTYGYNQKSRKMTTTYIASGTKLSVETVKKSLRKLIDRNILTSEPGYLNAPKMLSINKEYKKWHGVQSYPIEGYEMTGQVIPHDGVQSYLDVGYKRTPNTRQNKTRQKKQDRESGGTPTISEVVLYFSAHRFSEQCAKDFFDYYDALGWRVKGSRILKWEVFADRWMKTEKQIQPADPELDMWGNPIKREERE